MPRKRKPVKFGSNLAADICKYGPSSICSNYFEINVLHGFQ